MSRTGILAATVTVALLATPAAVQAAPPSQDAALHGSLHHAARQRATGGQFVLIATHRGPRYAPTFTGNGYLGVRIPAKGQGYVGGTVPAQSELAGFYAKAPGADSVQERANIPTWSTLKLIVGGHTFSLNTGIGARLAPAARPAHGSDLDDRALDRAERTGHRPAVHGVHRQSPAPRRPGQTDPDATLDRLGAGRGPDRRAPRDADDQRLQGLRQARGLGDRPYSGHRHRGRAS